VGATFLSSPDPTAFIYQEAGSVRATAGERG
jgi:hypothetical protein